VALACQRIIVPALERNPSFISAVLPNVVYPLMFNRYGEGMTFGAHVDGSVRLHPQDGRKIRTDVSATLFLTNPEDYDGGELLIEDTYGRHAVKLPAGDMVVYPATSLVRDDNQRALLYEMDGAIQRLNQTNADETARRSLIGCYHNLVRQWSET
jgi:PKHD-type hydroxylase